MLTFTGDLDNHFPKIPLLQGLSLLPFKPGNAHPSNSPIPKAKTAFTDVSKLAYEFIVYDTYVTEPLTRGFSNPGSVQQGELWQ